MNAFDDIKNRAKAVTEHEVSKKIQDSANNVLQAGLGSLAKQQEETGKVFEALVKQGQDIEDRARSVVKQQIRTTEDRIEGVRKVAQERVDAVRGRATVSIDRVESAIQEGVSQAIENIGMITNEQIAKLNRRIDELEKALDKVENKFKK
ncbi:poly(hydroxyalkanoate) granule-associated protein [gamma proteobacterium HTCC5015]|nr:poly(hydroxyalkanoate) granule-associated protein [gamma proteobacterium HTCC5015]